MTTHSQYRRLTTAALSLALSACSPQGTNAPQAGTPASATVRVVAVERVYGDLAQQIGGAGVDVTTLLNSPSADPHEYEPTPRDADAVAAADVVIENGLGYDAFAEKLAAASPRAGRSILVVGALGGHHLGDNPHVWYEVNSLRHFSAAFAADIVRRLPAQRSGIARRRDRVDAWIDGLSARLMGIASRHGGERVAITEPVFDYVLHAAGLVIATPPSFSHAIEEGNDPAPQDVDAMEALLENRRVAAFVYNLQTVEPSTTRLLEVARSASVHVVPVTETLPAGESTQTWIDGEVTALVRAL